MIPFKQAVAEIEQNRRSVMSISIMRRAQKELSHLPREPMNKSGMHISLGP